MEIFLNVKEEDVSQAVASKVIRIFMDENIKPSAVSLGGVACTSGKF